MNHPALYLRKVGLHRLGGLERPGFDVDSLAPGINIIYGPNGSGKSSLAGAITQLLDPGTPRTRFGKGNLIAEVNVDGQGVTIEYDSGHCDVRRDGYTLDLPALVPAGIEDRYVLPLSALISGAADKGLAEHIAVASAGGFDLPRARADLGFRKDISKRGKSHSELQQAEEAYRRIAGRQGDLQSEECQLADLRQKLEEARKAREELVELQHADEYLVARDYLEKAQQVVASFPQDMRLLHGDEMDRLSQLFDQRDDLLAAMQTLNLQRDEKRQELATTKLSESLPAGFIAAVRGRCRELENLATTRKTLEDEVAGLAESVRHARAAIGQPAADLDDALLEPTAVNSLFSKVRQGADLAADLQAKQKLQQWLDKATGDGSEREIANAAALREAGKLLECWLATDEAHQQTATPDDGVRRRWWLLAAATSWGFLAIAMTLVVHGSWLLGLIVSAGLIAWAFAPRRESSLSTSCLRIEKEYQSLAVTLPVAWTAEQVRFCLRQVRQRADAAAIAEQKQTRWDGVSQECRNLEDRVSVYEREMAELSVQLGLAETKAGEPLYLLVRSLGDWRFSHGAWQSAITRQKATDNQYCERLQQVSEDLEPWGYAPPIDAAGAHSLIDNLNERDEIAREARARLVDLNREETRLNEETDRNQNAIKSLFQNSGLKHSDERELRQRLDRLAEFKEADEEQRNAQTALGIATRRLQDPSLWHAATRETVSRETLQLKQHAGQYETLLNAIQTIETQVSEEKKKHDLEAALAHRDACREDLRNQREKDCDAISGNLLADFVETRQRQLQQPLVLQKARSLFGTVTRGRYQLDVSRGGPPEFRAIDTAREVTMPLAELSDGTRVQLLLCVRLAYLETQEGRWKLPLILDEALGNSDEGRADQIIDAAIEFCSAGRQVFYLTAQHDEVSKWDRRLRELPEVPSKFHDLAAIRQFSEVERVPKALYSSPPDHEPVPPPDGLDWRKYGQRLEIPLLDPRQHVSSAHLWYVIDNVEVLHRFLIAGINRWGQFRLLLELGKVPELDNTSPLVLRARARAEVLDAICHNWRVGRGSPVDRQIIEDSDAVSASFLDRLVELAQQVGGDGRELLKRLRAGELPRFREANIVKLEDYLREHGHYDARDPLSADDIRQRVLEQCFPAIDGGAINVQTVAQLVQLVHGSIAIGREQSDGLEWDEANEMTDREKQSQQAPTPR